jgi:hypothetical protein
MKSKLLAFALLSILSSQAQAFLPWCAFSYRYESFSLGLQYGYNNIRALPVKMDEHCWDLGQSASEELTNHQSQQWCKRAYDDGHEQGMEGKMHTITSPSECSNAGYIVGKTMLSVFARNQVASGNPDKCGKEYLLGRKDAKENRPGTIRSDTRLNHCYFTGYQDWMDFRQE